MPALILFASSGDSEASGPGSRSDRVKVNEDAEDVIKALTADDGHFAEFTRGSKPRKSVWINRDQVRMVRPA